MMHAQTIHSTALRRALLLDAAASGAMGAILLLAAGSLEPLLGLSAGLLRWAAAVLVPFTALLIWVAGRARAPRGIVRAIIGGNVLWTVGSVLLLASDRVTPTRLGVLFVLAQAPTLAPLAQQGPRGGAGGRSRACGGRHAPTIARTPRAAN